MDLQPHPHAVGLFFFIWVILGICGIAFFYVYKNAALKRKIFPIWIIGVGALLIGFASYITGQISPIMIFFVIIISVLNIRGHKICDACGKTNYGRNPFTPQKHCSNCGAPLK